MSDYEQALSVLFGDEGGYSPNDNNRGPVNMGITQKTLDRYWELCPQRCSELSLPKKVEDVDRPSARRFYQAFFWNPLYLGLVNDQQVATVLFSLGVNQGPGWALKHARVALGRVGSIHDTMVALNQVSGKNALLAGIYNSAIERYQDLAEKNPALYGDDEKGWELRLRKLCGIT